MLKLRAALTLHLGDVSTRRPFIGLYLTLPWVITVIIYLFSFGLGATIYFAFDNLIHL